MPHPCGGTPGFWGPGPDEEVRKKYRAHARFLPILCRPLRAWPGWESRPCAEAVGSLVDVPVSLSAHLRQLSDDDFEALLQRRVEVGTYLGGRWRRDMSTLTDILAQPSGIHTAAASLNSFLTQLLRLVVWLGPKVPARELADSAQGVAVEALYEGARELARWGLAFVDEQGPHPIDGWSVHVPACTMVAVSMPAGFGPFGRRLLATRSIPFLSMVARNVGLTPGPRRDKEAMVAEISVALAEPGRVQGLLAEAEPAAVALFDLIRDAGGGVGRRELMSAGHIRWSDPPWSERRKVLTPLDWLESRGLVIHNEADVYSGAEFIPAEVSLALRGGRLFETWEVSPPALAVGPVPGADHPGDPSRVLGDLEAVLEEWAQSRPAALQRGGLGTRELKKTAKNLGFDERYVSFLYAMAVEAELVGVNGDDRIVPSPLAQEWSALAPPVRWAALLDVWLGATLWTELDGGLVALDKVVRIDWLAHARAAVAAELGTLPPGMGTDAASLASRLSWRFPARFAGVDDLVVFVNRVGEALMWLGTAMGPNPLALLEPGRSAAREVGWAAGNGAGVAAFAAEVSTCTVGADLNVIVPGPPVPELGSALARFADLRASSPARIYKLSEASVRRALDSGMPATEITSVLEQHATTGIPQNVTYLIEDVARRHGNLVVGAARLFMRSEDPGLLRGAVADRRLAALHPRLIAPTVALLEGKDVDGVLGILRGAGYLPVAEAGGAVLRRGGSDDELEDERPPGVRRLLRPIGGAMGLSPEEAAKLAATLRPSTTLVGSGSGAGPGSGPAVSGPAGPAPAPPATGLREQGLLDGRVVERPGEIKELLDLAAGRQLVVEIMYVSQEGKRTTREIEPFEVDRQGVDAWCRLRDDERHFSFARIRWARATGERWVPALPGEEDTFLDLR